MLADPRRPRGERRQPCLPLPGADHEESGGRREGRRGGNGRGLQGTLGSAPTAGGRRVAASGGTTSGRGKRCPRRRGFGGSHSPTTRSTFRERQVRGTERRPSCGARPAPPRGRVRAGPAPRPAPPLAPPPLWFLPSRLRRREPETPSCGVRVPAETLPHHLQPRQSLKVSPLLLPSPSALGRSSCILKAPVTSGIHSNHEEESLSNAYDMDSSGVFSFKSGNLEDSVLHDSKIFIS
nr:WAS/WASL-interacting protein family member 3-like [Equus caballus]